MNRLKDNLLGLLAVANLVVLTVIGLTAPVFRGMYDDFGRQRNWSDYVLAPVHWALTIPLGIGVVIGLMWCSRQPSPMTPKVKAVVWFSVLLLAMSIILVVSYVAYAAYNTRNWGEVVGSG